MFSEKDKAQIEKRGSKIETVLQQIENFKNGFPYLQISNSASVGNGIIKLTNEGVAETGNIYDHKVAHGIKPLKFIPASGAASRMFKDLFEVSFPLISCKLSRSFSPVFSGLLSSFIF